MRSLAHVLPSALHELLRDTPLSPGKVTFAWRSAVGPAIGRATAVMLADTVLIVDADDARWAREVKRSSTVILPRLQLLLGQDVVASISVRRRTS